jgi:hypothetical protein
MLSQFSLRLILGIAASIFLTDLASNALPYPIDTIQLSTSETQHRYILRGTVPLFQNVSSRDSRNHRCMGYGNIDPDHVVDIQGKFSKLTFHLETRLPQNTTIIIQDPKLNFYCSESSIGSPQNTELTLDKFQEGIYKIWVGTLDSGKAFRYTLNLQSK